MPSGNPPTRAKTTTCRDRFGFVPIDKAAWSSPTSKFVPSHSAESAKNILDPAADRDTTDVIRPESAVAATPLSPSAACSPQHLWLLHDCTPGGRDIFAHP